jgi:GTPase SAR1 family protein
MKEYSYEDNKKPMFQNKILYKSLISNFYRNSTLVIMIYLIDDKNSFENTEKMIE